jgi:hypothetical protein
MSRMRAERFLQTDEADLPAYADTRADEMDLTIAAAFQPSVLENLTALQAHARRVSAALHELEAGPAKVREI